jgi:hypothetical protein
MLQSASAPAHSARHPHPKIQLQKLRKNTEVTAKEIRNGEILRISVVGQDAILRAAVNRAPRFL